MVKPNNPSRPKGADTAIKATLTAAEWTAVMAWLTVDHAESAKEILLRMRVVREGKEEALAKLHVQLVEKIGALMGRPSDG